MGPSPTLYVHTRSFQWLQKNGTFLNRNYALNPLFLICLHHSIRCSLSVSFYFFVCYAACNIYREHIKRVQQYIKLPFNTFSLNMTYCVILHALMLEHIVLPLTSKVALQQSFQCCRCLVDKKVLWEIKEVWKSGHRLSKLRDRKRRCGLHESLLTLVTHSPLWW